MNESITKSDDSRFFENGSVVLELCDPKSRMAAVRVCMPCCLFQTVTPHLLGGGTIDELKIADPLAIWVPSLSEARFAGPASTVPGISEKANLALREEATRIAKTFIHMSSYLVDPSDLIPILPLGTYITFLFRCKVESVIQILEGVNSIPVVGIHEFQVALASVLHKALSEFYESDIRKTKRLLNT